MKKIYTDGACFPNPGKGGWGWTDLIGNENSGSENPSTNQRMELMAVIDALEKHPRPAKITIITDSMYVINGATKWHKTWLRSGWRNSKGQPVKNRELWERLLEQSYGRVRFEWVKGHSGNPGNERADDLATEASGADLAMIAQCKTRWHNR